MSADVIVFLGPSLPLDEARRLLPADYRPPARQGDVFRALVDRPRVIALIDGVFESVPSVWHHELLAAHAAGVHVFGASSMGALRAAELPGVVKGVGEIARRYASGEWKDDALVALLHADGEHGFRPMTIPWVNVWATARAARRARLLSPAQERRLLKAASSIFYQSRTWRRVLEATRWAAALRQRMADFVRVREVNLKAQDARACLRAARRAGQRRPARPFHASSFVRRQRLSQCQGDLLDSWRMRADRAALEDQGARRLLLAGFARIAGLSAPAEALARWSRRLDGRGLADDERATLAEALALDEVILSAPERFLPDGPSRLEGLALEARLMHSSTTARRAR
ncbi:MAG: TfuA-like protein [Myxococcota bacterium]